MAQSEDEKSPETDVLGTLIGTLGKDDAFALVEAYGGTRVYVPHQFKETSPLADKIGVERASLLTPAFAGNVIKIPVARRWKATVYRERGMSAADIAVKLGAHIDTIRRILGEIGLGRVPRKMEAIEIDRTYWSGLSAVLRGSLPRGIPPHWPLMIHACTLRDIIDHIDRDLLHGPVPQYAGDSEASGEPANSGAA